jgi:hypothetical protein
MRQRQPDRQPPAPRTVATGSGRWPEPEPPTAEDDGPPTEEWDDQVAESFEQAVTLVNQKRAPSGDPEEWWDDEITKVDARTR